MAFFKEWKKSPKKEIYNNRFFWRHNWKKSSLEHFQTALVNAFI